MLPPICLESKFNNWTIPTYCTFKWGKKLEPNPARSSMSYLILQLFLFLTSFEPVCDRRRDPEPAAASQQQPAGVLHNQRRRCAAGGRLLESQRLYQLHLQQRHHSVFLPALSGCQLQGARLTQGPVLPTLSRWVSVKRRLPSDSTLSIFMAKTQPWVYTFWMWLMLHTK